MAEKILMKGNEAIAHAAIRCGCDGYFGYPITPQSRDNGDSDGGAALGNYRNGGPSGRE